MFNYLITFFTFYIIIFIIEYKLWQSLMTPLILTSAPIVFVILFNQTIGVKMGFYSINNLQVYTTLGIGITSIFFVSIIVKVVSVYLNVNHNTFYSTESNKYQIKHAAQILTILLVYKTLQIIFLYFSGIPFFAMKPYLSSGFSGYTTLLMIICVTFFYGAYPKLNLKRVLMIALSLIPLLLYGTRGWMIMALLGGVFFKGYYQNIWPKKIFLILAPFLGISFLMATYLYRNAVGDVEASLSEIFQHVIGYFVGGIQGLNQIIGSGYDSSPYLGMTYSAFINIKELLIGNKNYVSNVGPIFFNINHYYNNVTNVNTAFGTLFHGLGTILASIHIIVLYSLLYILYIFRNRIGNIYVLTFYSLLTAGVSLSFFEYYLGLFFYFLVIIFLIVLYLFHKFSILFINKFS